MRTRRTVLGILIVVTLTVSGNCLADAATSATQPSKPVLTAQGKLLWNLEALLTGLTEMMSTRPPQK